MAVYPLYTAGTPYNSGELAQLDFAQAFGTVYLAHEYYPPSKLVRVDHNDWTYSALTFGPALDAPSSASAVATVPNTDAANSGDGYFPQDYSYIVSAVNSEGQESRGSSSASATNDTELPRNYTTVSWSAPSGDVSYYRIYKAHETGSYGFIGESESTSFVDDGFQPDYSSAPIKAYNPFDTTGNYPSRTGFWEQRLWFGGTTNSPNGVFASRSADFENMDFSLPQRENDSISFSISTGESNFIEVFMPMDHLLVGTSDNIFSLYGPNDDVLVPSPPPGARRHVGRGVSLPRSLVIGEIGFYQPRIETGVRTIGYTFEIDGYRSNDVTIFAPHLFVDRRIVSWAYQPEPYSVIWAVLDDGDMVAFTWEAEQQVWGWSEMDVGGTVLDVESVPEGDESRVYITVERTINGATVRYVEWLESAKWTDYKTTSFLDCSRVFEFATATDTITGLEHLEGETVTVLMDGFTTTATVSAGGITLPRAASQVIVGLPYDILVETLDLPDEPRKKITGEIYVELVESFDVFGGRREDELQPFRTRDDDYIGPPVMYTGQPEPVRPDQVVDRQASIILKQSTPYPFTLTGLHYGVESLGRG